ncbi:DUF6286 domain-containing protein [Streptomyces humicola]|uniref:DUF6286 domain-containing protein n=1 Tax=Streptomyces humicola TaxID=2953240 RepID=UPI0035579CF9
MPAAITALLVLVVAGALLYDVSAVRAGRPAAQWRRRLAAELATRPLQDHWVILGAAVASLVGVWLLVLALTPGLRAVLRMRTHASPCLRQEVPPAVRAGVDRIAAALLLRDRATEVPGVRWVRVSVSRRRIQVRADAHFRELDDVRRDLDAVLEEAVHDLALARPLTLSLQVRRAGRG